MALRGTLTHRKTRRLARELSLPLPCALGVMEALWHVTAAHSPDGAIGRLSNQDIADEMFWEQDADALVNTLIACGFLDPNPEYRLVVHGWAEHADQSVKRKLARYGQGMAVTSQRLAMSSTPEPEPVPEPDPVPVPPPTPPLNTQRDLDPEDTADLSEREKTSGQDFANTPVPNTPPIQTRQEARSAELIERYGFDPQPDIHLHFGQPPNGSFFTSIYERLDYFIDQGTPITAEEFHDTALAVREATRSKYGKLPYTHKPLCDELANVVANRKAPAVASVNPNDPEHWHDPVPPNAIPSLQREVINFALDGNAAELTAYEALVWQKMRQWKCSDERIQAEIQAARHLAWKAAEKEQLTAALLAMPQFAEYRSAQC